MKADYFSEDVTEFLTLLDTHSVAYLIVGGEAVIYHGRARLTGDIDIFYRRGRENVEKLFQALLEFWDNEIPGIEAADELSQPGVIIQFGVPPNRIDLLNNISGVGFEEAWENRVIESIPTKKGSVQIYFIGKNELKKNKHAAARPKDNDDLNYL